MGLLDFLAAGYLAKRASNVAGRPNITVPDGYEIRGMKASGMNEWVIKYAEKGSSYTGQFKVTRNTTKYYMGGDTWDIWWP